MKRYETVQENHHGKMCVEPSPRSALVLIKAEMLLHVAVVHFDAPSHLEEIDENLHGRLFRHGTEVVFEGSGLL